MESDGSSAVSPAGQAAGGADHSIETLAFRACVAAVWSDRAMAAEERDCLSHVLDMAPSTPEQRAELRRMALHGVDADAVLDEVAALERPAQRAVLDHCLEILRSDRRLRRPELRFLRRLARTSGMSRLRAERWLLSISRRRRVEWLLAIGALLVVGTLVASRLVQPGPVPVPQDHSGGAHSRGGPVLLVQARTDLPELEAEQLFERVRSTVVTVRLMVAGAQVAGGSGVVIGRDPQWRVWVLTNRHVVHAAGPHTAEVRYEVQHEEGARFDAELDFVSARHDLALLLVPGLARWSRPAAILGRDQLKVGQTVYALGTPVGLRHTFTSGVISALRGDRLQTDATVHFGSSGGPLFDRRGLICGIMTESHGQKDLSFAIYGDDILDMLRERALALAPGQTGTS
jgi:hypothetical protein